MSRIAIYPGSFDPLTKGHLDIIRRASALFDELIVAVVGNPSKRSLFSLEEREVMLKESLHDIANVKTASFSGLLADFVRSCGACAIVRGLRGGADFENERQMAALNRVLAPDTDTVFLMTSDRYACVSSGAVKEIASLGGDISNFVTPSVEKRVRQRLSERKLC
ncbi:pantetheine-phosphate adenylyltransferase [bacterium]|nr:pantetheine-phosphate adenylyltransferase [bacterium]